MIKDIKIKLKLKFVALSIPDNSLYLHTGFAVPNFNDGSIYIPVGGTYNKGMVSYSLDVFMQNFTTPVGGEVKVGIRLFKW